MTIAHFHVSTSLIISMNSNLFCVCLRVLQVWWRVQGWMLWTAWWSELLSARGSGNLSPRYSPSLYRPLCPTCPVINRSKPMNERSLEEWTSQTNSDLCCLLKTQPCFRVKDSCDESEEEEETEDLKGHSAPGGYNRKRTSGRFRNPQATTSSRTNVITLYQYVGARELWLSNSGVWEKQSSGSSR